MNESSKNTCVWILALTAVLVVPGLLPQSAHGMYDPKHGRWLQRDPERYVDGMNLYQYVKSRPTVYVDWRGRQATRPTTRPPGTGPSAGSPPHTCPSCLPPSPQFDWPEGKWSIQWTEGAKSIWQQIAEGTLDHCPHSIKLPDPVESALRLAMQLTAQSGHTTEAGGGMSYRIDTPTVHRVWQPQLGRGDHANEFSAIALAMAREFKTNNASENRNWRIYGTYHTHLGKEDSTFSDGDVRLFMEGRGNPPHRIFENIVLMRNCKCTRALVRRRDTARFFAAGWWADLTSLPGLKEGWSQEELDSYVTHQYDTNISDLSKKANFCFYRSCGSPQNTLTLYGEGPSTGTSPSSGPSGVR